MDHKCFAQQRDVGTVNPIGYMSKRALYFYWLMKRFNAQNQKVYRSILTKTMPVIVSKAMSRANRMGQYTSEMKN